MPDLPDLETDLMTVAYHHYQAGRLEDAATLYRQIWAQQPERLDALNWLALIAEQQGQLEESVTLYQQLLSLRPDAADLHSNLGAVLGRLGRVSEAIAQHQQAVQLKPQDADAHYNLGVILYQSGQLEAAQNHYQQAVRLNPNHLSAHTNLGLTLYKQGRLAEALIAYQQAIAIQPNHLNAHNGLGVVLYQMGQLEAAIDHCQRAIALDANCFSAYNNLGTVLQRQGKLAEAQAQYERALAINPDYASAYDNLGTVCQEQKQIEAAISHYKRAIELDPASANAYNNLGSALKEQGNLTEAIACCREAIRLQPDHADAHNNYGSGLVDQGKFAEAVFHFEQTIRYKPDHANAHLNLGIILLMLGDYQRGFQEYHWRWQTKQCPDLRYPFALWDGSDPQGKIILLTAEQGFGDTLQFARYAPLVAQRGGCVVVACQKQLLRLLETLPGIDRCVDRDQVNVQTHVHAPLLDLPLLLGTTLETIPATVPYLRVPPGVTVSLPEPGNSSAGAGEGISPAVLKVGIVWASNPDNSTSKKRSCPLDHFVSLQELPGVQLYSLQKDISSLDQELLANWAIPDLSAQLHDFADTAGAIAQLDLVISVDTAVAHLAGALAKPVWTLLPEVADWRWLRERQDTPWYPTMRLFRQVEDGNWVEVFERLQAALREGIENPASIVPGAPPVALPGREPRMTGRNQLKACRHGTFLYNPADEPVGRSLDCYGEWAEGAIALFKSLLQPGDTVVEVGADIGAQTVFLAKAVGVTGRVVAITPHRLTFQLLCGNLALNNVTNVFCHQVWLAAAPGLVTSPAQANGQTGEPVLVTTLDSFGVDRCRMLVMRLPDKEIELLRGAVKTLERCQPILYVEQRVGDRPIDPALLNMLTTLDYDLYWHRFPFYNPQNFCQNSLNVFGEARLANILGFPRRHNIVVNGMERITI